MAIETEDLLFMGKKSPGPYIHLLKQGECFTGVWNYINSNNQIQSWNKLKINENLLESALKEFTPEKIIDHVNVASGMDFFGKLRQCNQVEQDNLFKYNTKYSMAFVKMIEQLQGMGSPQQLWDTWLKHNEMAMDINLAEKDPRGNQTSTSSLMKEKGISINEARDIILEGAEYRCKRNYAAFIREMYVVSSLASGNSEFGGMRVFWHPLWDTICKCDAIVVPENYKKTGIIGLGIYLKSKKSIKYANIKSNIMPQPFLDSVHLILSLAIPIESSSYQSGKIILPNEHQMNLLRQGLNGDRGAINQMGGAYYSRNENLIKSV